MHEWHRFETEAEMYSFFSRRLEFIHIFIKVWDLHLIGALARAMFFLKKPMHAKNNNENGQVAIVCGRHITRVFVTSIID